MKVYIGTSGFSYKDWRNNFYPSTLKADHYLEYYSSHFPTVEINSSFYTIPKVSTINKWREETPEDFCFAIKASRFITHLKKLKNTQELIDNFLNIISILDSKLGPILFQLPPKMKVNLSVFQRFLSILPANYKYVFEFRHSSWYVEQVYQILKEYNYALCIHDHLDAPSPLIITADYCYLRMHGPDGHYLTEYRHNELVKIANFINETKRQNDIYCYFNNDTKAFAINNAKTLRNLTF
jgi:uncharacterized protein YecE (DUF72 family)